MAGKHPKRPRDPSQLAKLIVDIASGDVGDTTPKRSAAAQIGSKGGEARAKSLTPKQRAEIAKVAAEARWKKS